MRQEYLSQLTELLSYRVSPSLVQSTVEYYDQTIIELMEAGYSEADAVAELPTPKAVLASLVDEPMPSPKRKLPLIVIILLVISSPLWGSLALAAAAILFSFYIVAWCLPFTGFTIGASFVFGGVVAMVTSPWAFFDTIFVGVTQFGVGLTILGLGIIALWLTGHLTKAYFKAHQTLWNKISRSWQNKKVVYA